MDFQPISPGKAALRIIAALLLGVAALLIAVVFNIILVSLHPALREAPQWVAGLTTHSGMLVGSLAVILIVSRGRVSTYGLRLPTSFPIAAIAIVSCGLSALFNGIGWFLPGEGLSFVAEYSFLQTVLLIWIYASVAEELLTRGLIQSFLAPLTAYGLAIGKIHISVPVLVGAVFFAAMHLMLLTMGIATHTVLFVVAFTFVGGLVAGYFRQHTDSLIPAIVVHALFNVTGSMLDLLWQAQG